MRKLAYLNLVIPVFSLRFAAGRWASQICGWALGISQICGWAVGLSQICGWVLGLSQICGWAVGLSDLRLGGMYLSGLRLGGRSLSELRLGARYLSGLRLANIIFPSYGPPPAPEVQGEVVTKFKYASFLIWTYRQCLKIIFPTRCIVSLAL